jgi:hypothetical protein
MRHHGGIIGEIEDEILQIERLALSGYATVPFIT